MVQLKMSGGDHDIRKFTLLRDQPEGGEQLRDDLRGESGGSQPIDTMTDDREARNDFWSIEGNYIYRHHVEPRAKINVLTEESFSPPRDQENTYDQAE